MTDEDREHCDKFVQACSEGNLAQALDMYLAWPTNKTMINRGFRDGTLDIKLWLCDLEVVDPVEMEYAFSNALSRGCLSSAAVLAKAFRGPDPGQYFHGLVSACSDGNLEVLQWMMDAFGEDTRTALAGQHNYCLRTACTAGQLEVAQWLVALGPAFNVHVYSDECFKYACKRNQLSVVQWLVKDHGVDPRVDKDIGGALAMLTNSTATVAWLRAQGCSGSALKTWRRIRNGMWFRYVSSDCDPLP